MAASVVEIVNSALIKLGATPIVALTDAVKEARLANQRYNACLKACLRNHLWNFALKRVVLSPTADTPAFGYTYSSALPSDCIRVIDVDAGDQDYRIEGRRILSNSNALELLYIYFNQEPTEYDSLFCEVLATYLAWDLCYAITQSLSLKQDCWQAHRELLRQARSVNAKEEIHDAIDASLWDEARLSSSTSRANR